jgi:queuosine precursor transporter
MKLHRFDVIVALYIFGIVAAQLMGAKVVPFGELFGLPLSISVAVFLMPLLFTITDVVVEVHGKARARSLVWTGLIVVTLLAIYTLFVTNLPAAERYSGSNGAYNAIFGTSIRFAAASIAAFLAAEIIDVLIYSKLRDRMKGKGMWLRNNASNFVGQLIDSTVFVVIAFYAFDLDIGANAAFLAGIILPYWLVRCLMSIAGTPLAYAGVAFLRKRDAGKLQSEAIKSED